jgi:hypothetical protein
MPRDDEMHRPLWQLLMLVHDPDTFIELSCAECFALLEYDAGCLSSGAELSELSPSVKHHLEICASCQAQLNDWLDELEKS